MSDSISRTRKYFKKYRHPGLRRFNGWFLGLLGRYALRPFYRVRVELTEPLPAEGPLLYLTKHQRNEDIPLGYGYVLDAVRPDNWCVMKDSLAKPIYMGFWLQAGGIPINRKNPETSKRELLLAREVLHDGHSLVLFPEQTHYVNRMGRGRLPGFRFIAGKPRNALQIVCIGFEYRKRGFLRRTEVIIRAGAPRTFTRNEDPALFLHDCMQEIARLSGLEYPFSLEGKRQPLSSPARTR